MKIQMLQGIKMRIVLHIMAWAILLGLPLIIVSRWNVGRDFIWFYYINIIVNGIIFYANYIYLIPKLFFRIPKYRYYISAFILLAGVYFANEYSNRLVFQNGDHKNITRQLQRVPERNMDDPKPPDKEREFRRPPFHLMHLMNFGFTNLFITFFALGLRVLERNAQIEKRQKELEKEKLNSELAFLKNQISPHFFFNTLNNIYSLIEINAGDSQNAILKLSRLMRYMLYESEQGQTTLSNEIEFMNNYIDLMRLRLNDKIKLTVDFPKKHENIAIPPLLFIPFIENAFKHGISYRENSFINIAMGVTQESITFRCNNSNVRNREEAEGSYIGIGLENVIKRLGLLFPERHDLKIVKSDNSFNVDLTIQRAKT